MPVNYLLQPINLCNYQDETWNVEGLKEARKIHKV